MSQRRSMALLNIISTFLPKTSTPPSAHLSPTNLGRVAPAGQISHTTADCTLFLGGLTVVVEVYHEHLALGYHPPALRRASSGLGMALWAGPASQSNYRSSLKDGR